METVLIFAGGDSPTDSLAGELPEADLVIAADSGYDLAVETGIAVDVLVGDMDSIETEVIPRHVVIERHPTDKDRTDLELALAKVIEDVPQRVVVVGGAGGRVDHEIASAALICSQRWRRIEEIDWVTERGWSHVVWDRRLVHGDIGRIISLIPMGGPVTGIRTKGLLWELTDAKMPAGTTWGVSNSFTAPVADIRVGTGCLLAVVPSV